MVCFFLMIRTLINKVLLRAWEVKPALTASKTQDVFKQLLTLLLQSYHILSRSLRTVASILFHLTFDYVKSTTPIQPDNQKHLAIDAKIKPQIYASKACYKYEFLSHIIHFS